MKQTIIILFSILLFSCGNKSETSIAKEGKSKIVAVWTKPDSTKEMGIMLRVIAKVATYDSVKKIDFVKVDTFFGFPQAQPLLDSTGKAILDSITKAPQFNPEPAYILIRKDSVNWRVSGIPLDELLKK